MGGNVSTPSTVSSKGSASQVVEPTAPDLSASVQAANPSGVGLLGEISGAVMPAAYNPNSPNRSAFKGSAAPQLQPQPQPQPQPQLMSPLTQQIMAQRNNPQFYMPPMQPYSQVSGLPMALALLRGQFNQMMAPRAPQQFMPIPQYRSPALQYRPNIAQVQQNLTRVKPSVYKSDLDAARARVAELEAQLAPAFDPFGGMQSG